MLKYSELISSFKKGLRNGNWRKLEGIERAFFRASLSVSRIKGKIVNPVLLEQLSRILQKLLETPGMIILRKGVERAMEMIERYEREGVFRWAPELRKWLMEKSYIEWLGSFST